MSETKWFLGFDIGGTKCAVSLAECGRENRIVGRRVMATAGKSWREILSSLSASALALEEERGRKAMAAGVSCGGPLDTKRGMILSPPNLPHWDEVPVVSHLEERLHRPVFLQNDANACAIAEWKFGAGRGARDMVFLTFGTGIGAGLILNGRLYEGASGLAGEVGHIRMEDDGPEGYHKRGSLEGFCSGGGIANLGRIALARAEREGRKTLLSSEGISAKSIAEAAEKGDEVALSIYRKSAQVLGRALAILIDLLNPERIVIGSIFARAEALLRPSMEETIKREALSPSASAVTVVKAALGENIGDWAAIATASEGFEEGSGKR